MNDNKKNQMERDIAILKDWREGLEKRFDKVENLISESHDKLHVELKEGLEHMGANISAAYGKYVKLEAFNDFKEQILPQVKQNSTFRNKVLGGFAVVSGIGVVNLVLLILMWVRKVN